MQTHFFRRVLVESLNIQHKAKHLVLLEGGQKYMGGIEELIAFAEKTMVPYFDRSEDDNTDWVAIARRECEVGRILNENWID